MHYRPFCMQIAIFFEKVQHLKIPSLVIIVSYIMYVVLLWDIIKWCFGWSLDYVDVNWEFKRRMHLNLNQHRLFKACWMLRNNSAQLMLIRRNIHRIVLHFYLQSIFYSEFLNILAFLMQIGIQTSTSSGMFLILRAKTLTWTRIRSRVSSFFILDRHLIDFWNNICQFYEKTRCK